ncbi:hypothetical protein GVY41_14415 [Frigidibacter albus]|uniref:Flagellar FliJ protein n=1 Tax=Frigidibacter albus TaxID=1465486 RepID=A0A6L8VME3_9RHOB|nr:hypothetical protein [Frigidibacter albus]MZQ90310.1 hypothetical protein [Frigidibacter albus]NBE32192.1 hypothetical protein [Frigidibacter albus]GGH58687.1 hypothetical protein GCM10011341_29280 [Frigidibacter albus]
MSRARDISALARLAALERDRRLQVLRDAGAARADTLAALAELNAAQAEAQEAARRDGSPVLQGCTEHFQDWIRARKAALNPKLARETAIWLEARAAAATAQGRRDVLDRLAADQRAERLRQRTARRQE